MLWNFPSSLASGLRSRLRSVSVAMLAALVLAGGNTATLQAEPITPGPVAATAEPAKSDEVKPEEKLDRGTPISAPAISETLLKVLSGGNPGGIADLRAMQEHIRKMTDKLMEVTVGVQVGAAQGSGVIISKDGYVLTAAHVAGQPNKECVFIMQDGRMLRGKTLGLDRGMDAGLMKITEGENFPYAEMGKSDDLKVGQWCLAMGHPGGYQPDRKPVLRIGRILFSEKSVITTDCTLVGGDSGGPLFDMTGKVIGINSRIAGPITANMHVPVGTFQETWDRMVKGEAWGHLPGNEPFVGVRGDAEAKDAKIAHVFPNSPAEKAGLKVGDIVLEMDGDTLTDFASLTARVRDRQPGDKMKLKVKRGEEMLSLSITIGKRGG